MVGKIMRNTSCWVRCGGGCLNVVTKQSGTAFICPKAIKKTAAVLIWRIIYAAMAATESWQARAFAKE
jgi:hypothetical protein